MAAAANFMIPLGLAFLESSASALQKRRRFWDEMRIFLICCVSLEKKVGKRIRGNLGDGFLIRLVGFT